MYFDIADIRVYRIDTNLLIWKILQKGWSSVRMSNKWFFAIIPIRLNSSTRTFAMLTRKTVYISAFYRKYNALYVRERN